MNNWLSGDITPNQTRLHYYRTGGAKPPLVLLHGITDDGLCWTAVAEVLSADYDIIMVDLPGHGQSDPLAGGYTLGSVAADVAALIRGLGLDRPHILGHSLGAITALVIAGLFPDVPRSVLLEDPPAFWNFTQPSPQQTAARDHLIGWMKAIKRKTRADLLRECHQSDPTWSAAELEPWADSKHRFDPDVAALVTPSDLSSLDFPNLVSRITCPVLYISADPQRGAASSQNDIAMLSQWLPQLQVAPIADAGHNIHRDQFAHYLEVVRHALADFQTR